MKTLSSGYGPMATWQEIAIEKWQMDAVLESSDDWQLKVLACSLSLTMSFISPYVRGNIPPPACGPGWETPYGAEGGDYESMDNDSLPSQFQKTPPVYYPRKNRYRLFCSLHDRSRDLHRFEICTAPHAVVLLLWAGRVAPGSEGALWRRAGAMVSPRHHRASPELRLRNEVKKKNRFFCVCFLFLNWVFMSH